jgi:hypothetical protein
VVSLCSSQTFSGSYHPHISSKLLSLPYQAICDWIHDLWTSALTASWLLGSERSVGTPTFSQGSPADCGLGWPSCAQISLVAAHLVPARGSLMNSSLICSWKCTVIPGFREPSICRVPTPSLVYGDTLLFTWNLGSIICKPPRILSFLPLLSGPASSTLEFRGGLSLWV